MSGGVCESVLGVARVVGESDRWIDRLVCSASMKVDVATQSSLDERMV